MASAKKKPAAYEPTNVDGYTLKEWTEAVSKEVEKITSLGLEHFPDKNTYDDWKAGVIPEEAAEDYLGEEGYDLSGD